MWYIIGNMENGQKNRILIYVISGLSAAILIIFGINKPVQIQSALENVVMPSSQLPVVYPIDDKTDVSRDKKMAVFIRDIGDHRPSEDFAEGTDNFNQLVIKHLGALEEEVIVGSGYFSDLKVSNLPDDYPIDKLIGIAGAKFSLDNSRIYFSVSAWVTSGAVFYVDLKTKEVRYFVPGNLSGVIKNGEYRSDLLIYQRDHPKDVAVYSTYVVDPTTGSRIKKLDNDFDDSIWNGIVDINSPAKTDIEKYPVLSWETKTIRESGDKINIDIEYPQFVGGEPVAKLNRYIAEFIQTTIFDDKNKSKYIIEKEGYDDYYGIDLTARYRVLGVLGSIVSIDMVITSFTGGGNGNHDVPIIINWDLNADRLLEPKELFCSKNYWETLIPLMRKYLIAYFENDPYYNEYPLSESTIGWINEGIEIDPNHEEYFLLSNNGLVVAFPPYVVSSGASGIVRTLIPNEELLGLLCI